MPFVLCRMTLLVQAYLDNITPLVSSKSVI
jgi:hypothetical protein